MRTILILLLATVLANATTYYVDFVRRQRCEQWDDYIDSVEAVPRRLAATGVAAAANPAPGDVIAFKSGVQYNGVISVKTSGTTGARIVYDGNFPGWGNGVRAVLESSRINMNLKDYITVQNMDFFHGGDAILGDGHATLSQDFWLIYNCHFRDFGGQAITFNGDVNDSTIDSCTFEYINYLRGGDGP